MASLEQPRALRLHFKEHGVQWKAWDQREAQPGMRLQFELPQVLADVGYNREAWKYLQDFGDGIRRHLTRLGQEPDRHVVRSRKAQVARASDDGKYIRHNFSLISLILLMGKCSQQQQTPKDVKLRCRARLTMCLKLALELAHPASDAVRLLLKQGARSTAPAGARDGVGIVIRFLRMRGEQEVSMSECFVSALSRCALKLRCSK